MDTVRIGQLLGASIAQSSEAVLPSVSTVLVSNGEMVLNRIVLRYS